MRITAVARQSMRTAIHTMESAIRTIVAPIARAGICVVDPRYKLATVVKDTPFAGVNGATIGGDDALYVVHSGDGTATRIDLEAIAATEFVHPWAGVFLADDITSDGKHTFYATGTTPLVGEVYRIDAAGVKTVIASGLTAPNGIQFNKKTGRLFVTECFFQASSVLEIDPAGAGQPRRVVEATALMVPEGFDFDPDTQDLIIPDFGSGRILRVNPDSGAIQSIAEQLTHPIALKVGPDHNAYVPELGGAVHRLSLDGKIRDKLAQLPPGLDNLAITPDGRLFVTSYWDATVYEVATDGSGRFKTLFHKGANTLNGLVVQNGQVFVSDAIMIRTVQNGAYAPTQLNAWTVQDMPFPLGLTQGPGDQLVWPDAVHNAIAIGNPRDGTFKAVGGLDHPVAVAMSQQDSTLYVAEYGAGQVTEISLTSDARRPLVTGLDGPIALAVVDDALYIAEARAARIRRAPLSGGKSEVFVSSEVGKVGALAGDGHGGLITLDVVGRRLLRIDPKKLAITPIADGLPVSYGVVGSGPASVEFPAPMHVTARGDIYLGTTGRGVIALKRAG